MNRERFAWTVSALFLCALAFRLPGSFAQRDDDYAFVRTLVDVERQVAANYVEPVDSNQLRQAAIDGMLSNLDPYSVYVPPALQEQFDRSLEGTFRGVGIMINQREDGAVEVISPVEGSPAHAAGILSGDVILKVNGESVQGMPVGEVTKRITGKLDTEVKITVRHDTGEEVELAMQRKEIIVPTVKGFKRKPDQSWDYFVSKDPKIAYIRLTQFTTDTFPAFEKAVKSAVADGAKGLILDLRFNPGGMLDQAKEVVDLFVDEGVIVTTKGRNRREDALYAVKDGTLSDLPLVVLVNEHSASAAEIVAGSLKDHNRATVIGNRSYGKGSVQELIQLDDQGGELKLTTAYYYLPSGRLVHRKKDATDWGVDPQITVDMDDEMKKFVERGLADADLFTRTTQPATTRVATTQGATTRPIVDTQLETAVTTLVGRLVMLQNKAVTTTTAPAQ